MDVLKKTPRSFGESMVQWKDSLFIDDFPPLPTSPSRLLLSLPIRCLNNLIHIPDDCPRNLRLVHGVDVDSSHAVGD